jgi:hypothetical protein
MQIFTLEELDGLSDLITKNSVACLSSIEEYSPSEKIENCKVFASSANPEQPDLFYFKSVLVSSGWNNNDDIFLPLELIKAAKTPSDKQTNYMHKETEIIGHITDCYLSTFDYMPLTTEEAIARDELNIITNAVVYKSWADQELQEKYLSMIEEIKDGKWAVSMECIFTNFDYMLLSKDGTPKIIKRDEKTSSLSKHLKVYGGTGVYLNYRIGRILRDFVFSGQGIVDRPANPKSLILKTIAGEKTNMDEIMKELEACKAELASAKQTIESLTEFKTKAETLETSYAQSAQELSAVKQEFDSLKSQLEEVNKTLAQVITEKETAVASYEDLKKKMKGEKRKAALVEAGFENEEVETSLASFEALDDDSFEKIVAMMKKNKSKMVKKEEETEASASLVVEVQTASASLNEIATSTEKTVREKLAERFSEKLKVKPAKK